MRLYEMVFEGMDGIGWYGMDGYEMVWDCMRKYEMVSDGIGLVWNGMSLMFKVYFRTITNKFYNYDDTKN